MAPNVDLSVAEVRQLARTACERCGASATLSASLVQATLSAILSKVDGLGLPHLFDYLESFGPGRINGQAKPKIETPLPAFIRIDGDHGIAQFGFDMAYERLKAAASTFGVAVLTQKNCYTAGELGYYVRRLANDGFMSITGANGPALMAASSGSPSTYCTNPMAFGVPLVPPAPPLVIDQASSATAFINILRAAETGSPIPEGWAIDKNGAPTTDSKAAILGSLLPFGGRRGANIALFVEFLAAGVSGALWSLDAGQFHTGNRPPDVGHTVIAIATQALGDDFAMRATLQVERLRALGVHVPGAKSCANTFDEAQRVEVARIDIEKLRSIISNGSVK